MLTLLNRMVAWWFGSTNKPETMQAEKNSPVLGCVETGGRDRPLHDSVSLAKLMAPKSIAVVGVSEREGSFGRRTWENLQAFSGELVPVHPTYGEYQGRTCYTSIASLPLVPDCVVVCTARDQVLSVVRECADARVGGVIVFASGFSELGLPERVEEQAELAAVARKAGIPLLGPNCMGIINFSGGAAITFAPNVKLTKPTGHAIALVSQSGAIGSALLQAAEHGTSFSHMLTSGNACDVDAADQLAFLADDPACRAIACVLESISSAPRLIAAARKARAAGKPVVVYKVARTPVGAEAAQSHTGAMMSSDAASRAIFRAAGMVPVDDLEHLLETTVFLAKAARCLPLPAGVAVLTASGGLGIQAADSAYETGVPMPQPLPQAIELLSQTIPPFGSARNPCDVTAQVVNDLDSLGRCARILLEQQEFGVLVHPHTGAHAAGLKRLQALEAEAARTKKLACFVWSTAWLEGPGATEAELMSHGAVFRSMRSCFQAISALAAVSQPLPSHAPEEENTGAHVRSLLRAMPSSALSEREGMELLREAGLPVVRDVTVNSGSEAAIAFEALGSRPVVMKVVSRDIAHKSDVGGVVLNIATAVDAEHAFQKIIDSVSDRAPRATIEGVVLQPMAAKGVELILGARRDAVAGPLVMVGLGGVMAEVMADVAVRIAPFDVDEAVSMLYELRGRQLLEGFRGLPPVDKLALAQVISRFSRLAADLGDEIEDMEINPLICLGNDVIAVDALVRRSF